MSLQDHDLIGIGAWVNMELRSWEPHRLVTQTSETLQNTWFDTPETLPLVLGPQEAQPDKQKVQEPAAAATLAVKTAQPRNKRAHLGPSPATSTRRLPRRASRRKSPSEFSVNCFSVKKVDQDADIRRKYAQRHHWARMGQSALSGCHVQSSLTRFRGPNICLDNCC